MTVQNSRVVHVYLEEEPALGDLYTVTGVGNGIVSVERISELWALRQLMDRVEKERFAKFQEVTKAS